MRWSCVAWWFHKQMRWPELVYTRSDFIFVWAIDFVYSSPPLADNGSSARFASLVNHQKLEISQWLHEAKATAPCMNGLTWYQSSTYSHKLAKCFRRATQPRNLHRISQSQFQLMPVFRQCYQMFSPFYVKLGGVKQHWMKKSLPTFTCNSLRDVRLSCMLVPPSESTIQQWFVEVAGAKSSKATMPVVTSAQAACAAYTNGQAVVN